MKINKRKHCSERHTSIIVQHNEGHPKYEIIVSFTISNTERLLKTKNEYDALIISFTKSLHYFLPQNLELYIDCK